MAGAREAMRAAKLERKRKLALQRERNEAARQERETRLEAMQRRAPRGDVQNRAESAIGSDPPPYPSEADDDESGTGSVSERGDSARTEAPAEKMRRGRPAEDKMKRQPVPSDKSVEHDPLEGVPWASKAAERLARKSGLTAESFEGLLESGVRGYTTSDVRLLLSTD